MKAYLFQKIRFRAFCYNIVFSGGNYFTGELLLIGNSFLGIGTIRGNSFEGTFSQESFSLGTIPGYVIPFNPE
jgi:hypothetical protein